MQDRENLSINSNDTSISAPKQLESAIPPSKIAALSSEQFVEIVADDSHFVYDCVDYTLPEILKAHFLFPH